LLQNSERRYDEALHRKIDVHSEALAHLLEERDGSNGDLSARHAEELRAAVGLEEKL
jgi:hypothetical protein